MTNSQIVQRAVDASLVLENEAYKQAMQLLKSQVVESWKDCPVRDTQGQLLLLQLAKLCDKFECTLSGMVENGKMSARVLELDSLRNESAVQRFARKAFKG